MRSMVLLFVSLLYGLANFYIGNRIANTIKPGLEFNLSLFVYIPILLLTVSSLVAYLQPAKNWKIIGTMGLYWFALVILALFILGATDLLLFLISHMTKNGISFPILLTLRIIDAILLVILFVTGIHTANYIKITPYEITIDSANRADSLKIAMFSDLHLGYINGSNRMKEIVEKINSLHPDIVVIPGDFFDGNYNAVQNPQEIISLLRQMKSTNGTYLSWGNHDAGDTYEDMKKFILSANITILEDEAVMIEDKIALAGRKDSFPIGYQGDGRKDISLKLQKISDSLPVIVLDHQPSQMGEYKHADLILSGHTHQGQVFPFNLVTKKAFTVDYGYYENDGKKIIVTSGVGTWGPPIRIGTKSEIVEIIVNFEIPEAAKGKAE